MAAELDPKPGRPRAIRRRLSDEILLAFNQTCDQGELDVAERLLEVADGVLNRAVISQEERRAGEAKTALLGAYERLWLLRHPNGPGE